MNGKYWKLGILGLIVILILGGLTAPVSAGTYDKSYTDETGDVYEESTGDEVGGYSYIDIVSIATVDDGVDNVTGTMVVDETVDEVDSSYTFTLGDTADWVNSVIVGTYASGMGMIIYDSSDPTGSMVMEGVTASGATITFEFDRSYVEGFSDLEITGITTYDDGEETYMDGVGYLSGAIQNGNGGDGNDTDDDGIPDDYEDANGMDKNDASDANEDADGDMYPNIAEYKAGTDPNDASDYPDATTNGNGNGNGNGAGTDPATETATDTSINVDITKTEYSVEEVGENVEIKIMAQGTTSGVDHCEFIQLNYYEDGSHDDVYWEEEFDQPFGDITAYHFKATSDNWETWEYRMEGSIPKSMYQDDGDGDDGKKVTKAMIYVRAFSDAAETKWNQASKDVTSLMPGNGGGGGDGDGDGEGGFLPGFEAVILIAAFGAAIAVAAVSRNFRK